MSKITLLPESLIGEPEVVAMLQAFYSRSSSPIQERLDTLGENVPKIKEALAKWYIGYSHDSIGDTGNVAVFFEGVSMLFAKALQDNPLYNGQETSTRFFDYRNAVMTYPTLNTFTGTKCSWTNLSERKVCEDVQNSWAEFYTTHIDTVIEKLKLLLPLKGFSGLTATTWETSIKARAFDIMRAFLPAGTQTQLSFYGSLRNLRDSLSMLEHHPLIEVSDEATSALALLASRYPCAFANKKFNQEHKVYLAETSTDLFYNNTDAYLKLVDNYTTEHGNDQAVYHRQLKLKWKAALVQGAVIQANSFDANNIPAFVKSLLNRRPFGLKVPFHLGRYGNYKMRFFLDYGSFRDLQRHRNCNMPLPILTSDYGMHPWYLDQLRAISPNICMEAENLIARNSNMLEIVVVDSAAKMVALQYIHPMGCMVPVEMNLALDELFYIAELRSSKTVHPTLRPVAQAMGRFIRDTLKLKVYFDESEDGFLPWRGRQTISKVE